MILLTPHLFIAETSLTTLSALVSTLSTLVSLTFVISSSVDIDRRRHAFLHRDRVLPRLSDGRSHLEGVGTRGDLIHESAPAAHRNVRHAARVLSEAAAVQLEGSFVPLYKN